MERAKAHRWGRLTALFAVLAILFQATVIPTARAEAMELCTAHGTKTVLVVKEGPVAPTDCGHCGHCVLTSPADMPSTSLQTPVRYFEAVYVVGDAVDTATYSARGPPRPPGQAPPSL